MQRALYRETEFDAHEALDIVEYDIAELKQMVLDGKIEDAKTIAAIMIVAVKRDIKDSIKHPKSTNAAITV